MNQTTNQRAIAPTDVNAQLFSIYTMLYANDTACNCIRDIQPLIPPHDKQALKIYGALKKRIRLYDQEICRIVKSDITLLADYNSYVDDTIDPLLRELYHTLCDTYIRNGVQDAPYLARVELARAMTDLSVTAISAIYHTLVQRKIYGFPITKYKLAEINNIMASYSQWAFRHIREEIDLNEPAKILQQIGEKICSYELFFDAYDKTDKDHE